MRKQICRWSLIAVIIYAQIFANNCSNCCVEQSGEFEGKILWTKTIINSVEDDDQAGYMLTADSKIFVISQKKIIAFDSEGTSLWNRLRWPMTPVVLRNDKVYFTSEDKKSSMQAVNFNNELILEEFWMPEVIKESFLVLFEPIENGLIAQVQYMPDPNDAQSGFIVYKVQNGSLGMDWEKSFYDQRSKVIPIINTSSGILVTSNLTNAFVFDIINSKNQTDPIYEFALPLGENTTWLSSSRDGNLYWLGKLEDRTVMIVTEVSGKKIMEWNSEKAVFEDYALPILPVIVAPEFQYVLTKSKLYALKDGNVLWEINSEDNDLSNATALKDNSILVVKHNLLMYYTSDGNKKFELKFDEPILSAPVLDESGQIYVITNNKIHAIH